MNPTPPVWGHGNQPGLFQQSETPPNPGLGENRLTLKELQADSLTAQEATHVLVYIRVSMPLP